MNTIRLLAPALTLAVALALSACDDSQDTAPSAMSQAAANAQQQISEKFATENFRINRQGQPKAEITPQGDLLIEGKAVPVTPEQRKLLQDYRSQLVKIAMAGMGIGVQGAELAGKAVTEALKGVLTGDTDHIEKKVKTEAGKVEESAKQLCALLPAVYESQQKLAQSLPAFVPYAQMTQKDVSKCHYNIGGSGLQFGHDEDDSKADADNDSDDDADDSVDAKVDATVTSSEDKGNAAEEADAAGSAGK